MERGAARRGSGHRPAAAESPLNAPACCRVEIEPLRLGEPSSAATRLTIYCGHADRVSRCSRLRGRLRTAVPAPGCGRHRAVRHRWHRGRAAAARAPPPSRRPRAADGDRRGQRPRIGMLLPELGGLFRHPLMTVAQVRLCKRDGQFVSRPEAMSTADEPAGMTPQVKLTVYTSEATRVGGEPAHRAIVRRLRFGRRRRRHRAARHLGLPRRARTARRPLPPARPSRSGGHDDHRPGRPDRRRVRHYRRAHPRPRPGDRRDGADPTVGRGPSLRSRAGSARKQRSRSLC